MVIVVNSVDEFDNYISKGPVVVDCYADWCGPCKAIAPHFAALAYKYPNIKFLKVDTDKLKEVSERYQVASIPTFIAFNDGKIAGRISGANPAGIDQLVEKLIETSQAASAPSRAPQGFASLKSHIVKNQLEGLNVKGSGLSDLVDKKGSIESDCDEQVILTIPFNGMVKIHSLEIIVKDVSKAPQLLKFFINQTFTFDDVEGLPSVQEVKLLKEDFKKHENVFRATVELKYVKFQRVPKLNVKLN